MKDNFRKRGYPINLLNQAIKTARQKDRRNLLIVKEKTLDKSITFTTCHNPHNPQIQQIINQRKDILERSPETYRISQAKMILTPRRTPNLRQLLVRSDLKRRTGDTGSGPCKRNCHICRLMLTTRNITSHSNKIQYQIKESINCNSFNVIYIIQCRKCEKQYVGQTGNTLIERFYGHKQDIRNNNQYKPVSKHFTSANHSIDDVTVAGICTTVANINTRLRTEEAFIQYLNTQTPWGLNLRV